MKAIVVGSGLAAVGAVRALLKMGHRPVVLDIGNQLPEHLAEHQSMMAQRLPSEWSNEEWERLGRNEGVSERVVPRKLVFGSDYFYSPEQADMTKMDEFFDGTPPWSSARGGFSVGWGAAVLPPAPSDVADWPVSHAELLRHMREVLVGVPVSEPDDEIGRVFGQLRPEGSDVLQLSEGQTSLLERLKRARNSDAASTVLVGQSRLLTQAGTSAMNRCRFCGHCSSGCVYGSIYTAEQDITRWIREGQIDYRSGATVFEVREQASSVVVRYKMRDQIESIEGDRLFVAAGAVNTARILLNSSAGINSAILHRTGGALQLFATYRPIEVTWPDINTQTSHFLEIYAPRIMPFWAHVQVGQPNELVLRRIGLTRESSKRLLGRSLRLVARHLVSAALNVHSSFGPQYEIRLVRTSGALPNVHTSQHWNADHREVVNELSRLLGKSLKSANLFRIPGARQDSVAAHGYHFGASFPMTRTPRGDRDTDSLGRPYGWQRIHVVDTSVLPAIPATTVGLLTMANAHRIALSTATN